MASEVGGIAIAMEPIDDLHLLVQGQDILRPLVLRYLDVDIAGNDELALVLQLEHLTVHPVQQLLQDEGTGQEPQGHEQDHHCEQSVFVYALLFQAEDALLLAKGQSQ